MSVPAYNYPAAATLYLVFALLGVLIFCGAAACCIEFLKLGSVVVPLPGGASTSLTGIKALGFVGGCLVCGVGVFCSSVYQFRKAGRL